MADEPQIANSLAEAFYHVLATACPACGHGPVQAGDAHTVGETSERPTVDITATCRKCGHQRTLAYKLNHGTGLGQEGTPATVNPTSSPSTLLDVTQWIMLFRLLTTQAAAQTDKAESRRLGLEAAQCLDEALKFYDDPENDLPPGDAFFHDSSRERLKSHPEMFSRQRLLGLRARLPSEAAMRKRILAGERPKKRWWQFWKS